jgi:hypothetical protein
VLGGGGVGLEAILIIPISVAVIKLLAMTERSAQQRACKALQG